MIGRSGWGLPVGLCGKKTASLIHFRMMDPCFGGNPSWAEVIRDRLLQTVESLSWTELPNRMNCMVANCCTTVKLPRI